MTDKKYVPRIGDDGYAIYTYGVGALWIVETETGNVHYKIIEPIWNEEGLYEAYIVEVKSEKEQQLREMTLERLNYLLSSSKRTTLMHGGIVRRFPLLREEVERYYQTEAKERSKQKREALAKLKADEEYQAALGEEKLITPLWTRAIAQHSDEESKIEKRMEELALKKKKIFKKYGINAAVLSAPETCAECDGKGITEKGAICACAKAQQNEIQAYSAAARLVERRKKEQFKEDEREKTETTENP